MALLVLCFLLPANKVSAQSYIDFSKYAGGGGDDAAYKMDVVNGEAYLLSNTSSADFPVTNGSVFGGKKDLVLTKYSSTGAVLYSIYLGGKGTDNFAQMKVVSGEVYIVATTDSTGYPVTNGSAFKGSSDIVFTKISSTGSIIFSGYIGGTASETVSGELQVAGSAWFIAGTTSSADFPATSGGNYKGGTNDAFIVKLSTTDGSTLASRFLGGSNTDNTNDMFAEGGAVFITGNTSSGDIPVSIGSPLPTGLRHMFIYKLSGNDLSNIYSRYLGGTREEFITNSKVVNGELHIAGFTYSPDYPVTNGSTTSGEPSDPIDGFYTRLNGDGSIGFSTYLTTGGFDLILKLLVADGDAYVAGVSVNPLNTDQGMTIFKIANSGSIAYTKSFPMGVAAPVFPSFKVLNGDLYFAGAGTAPNYPVTNGSQFYNGGTGFFTHLNPSGDLIYSSFLGKMSSMQPLELSNNKFYVLGTTNTPSYPVTDSSKIAGAADNLLIILNPDGSNFYSGYTGGAGDEAAADLAIDNDAVYFAGRTTSADYPVTENTLYKGNGDAFLTKISFCSSAYDVANDIVSPATQTACKFGLSQKITGKKIMVPGTNLPGLFLNGAATAQKPLESKYQWQVATAPAGPWTDIAGAILKDYTPVIGGADQYYRRLAFAIPSCGGALLHTSDVATVSVNALTAPAADAGGTFTTCPGSLISIGGAPSATGGAQPYTYEWDMGAGTTANPSVSPNVNTVYTLVVTDAAGCRQISQAVVFSYAANAGADKSNCAGTPVKIGTPQLPGNAGVTYSWLPATDLSDASAAQPLANPLAPVDYELTVTVPKTGGGTCTTKDTVSVSPIAAPATPNFAGADKAICLGETAPLGTPAEAGFTYTWSPGNYLSSNTGSTANYNPGNINMPVPNPAIINLTAQKGGCTFTDQTIVSVIESRAGILDCGPRIVGMPDRTPSINETYNWIKISGPGNFTGATNLAQVPVSASAGGTTVYGLIATYQGHGCFSQVVVPESCIGCQVLITVDAKYKCPGFAANNGDVTLIAYGTIGDATYTWEPQQGLSNYTGSTVHLTDNVPRTYTVTATSIYNPLLKCTGTVTVNDPSLSVPVFPAPDVNACAGIPVAIGLPPVAGYIYEWTGTGLSNNFTSNPFATVALQTAFPIKISDINGCEIQDTVVVNVQNVSADAGPDRVVCSNGVITLGTPAQPGTSYVWEPQASPWQNGTDQFSAQPQVLVAADVTFTVTATTSAGCVTIDNVEVHINNSPTIPAAPDAAVCAGKSVVIGSPALPGVTYQWLPATGLNDPTLAQPTASPAVNTTYTLTATFPGTCGLPTTDQVFVKLSDASFTMPDINFCPGSGPVFLGAATPAGMSNYNWQPQALVTNPFIANPSTLTPPPSVATSFILSVTNPDGCLAEDTLTLIPGVVKPDAGIDKVICKNSTTSIGSAGNTTGPNISYSWSPAVNLDNPFSPNPVFTGTTGGTFMYVLTKTDNSIPCSSKDTVMITVTDFILPPINGAVICQNSCVQIGTAPVAGIQYQWSPQAGLSNAAVANPVACVGTVTAAYTLTATDVNGCTASANVVVGVNPVPAAQINIPPVTACVGDNNVSFNPVINPAGTYTYLWSPADGTLSNVNVLSPTIIITGAGSTQYTLQVTDNATGCTNTAVATLTVNNCSPLANVGNFVWFDVNLNGLQDVGEIGVSGMIVQLYNSAGFNVATSFTDANGFYTFGNISPGNDYYVIFSKPQGYLFTTQNVGGVTAPNNSKADPAGRSINFNVAAGAGVVNIDAGIKPAGAVPVTLLSFTAALHNHEVLLNWQTTAEYNNRYFDVERSNDGVRFIAIGRVAGNSTTSLPHSYSLTDPHPVTGMNYYRLKQVDFDGRSIYSRIAPIQITGNDAVTAYYTAAANRIQILFGKKQAAAEIKLYAANGQLIKSAVAENASNYALPLPALPKGVYMLQVGNEGLHYSQKIFIGN
jgi:hypothetical protein